MFRVDLDQGERRHSDGLVTSTSPNVVHGILKSRLHGDKVRPKSMLSYVPVASDDSELNASVEDNYEADEEVSKHVEFSECNNFQVFNEEDEASETTTKAISSEELTELWAKCKFFETQGGSDDRKSRDGSLSLEGFERCPELVLCFTDPCNDVNFADELQVKRVKLESCKVRDRHVLGIISLQITETNDAHDAVFISYSTDKGDPPIIVTAKRVEETGEHYIFDLDFPMGAMEIEFVVCCKYSSGEYLDDNLGEKYKVQDIRQVIALENDSAI